MSQPEPRPFQPTRQQLDELEALMQRMLALPVESPETKNPPESEALASSTLEKPEPPFSQDGEWSTSSALFTPAEPARLSLPLLAQTAEFATLTESLPEPVETAPSPVEEPTPFVRRRPVLEWWARPLQWSNRVFDHCTLPLGESGRWLRSRRGRAWLGYSGLLFLVTAVAWSVLDWIGWL
jgi:hypothetical protein